MTVEETMALSTEAILKLQSGEVLENGSKHELPTILDVVEYLSSKENNEFLANPNGIGIGADWFDEGKYMWVTDKPWTNIPKLMQTSMSTFTLMRGQNDYYAQCQPSFFRKKQTDVEILIQRLRTAEFMGLLTTHPVILEVQSKCKVEYLAIAQHYGFPTEYIDITNNKWVAAFFASCRYDEKTEKYTPVDENFGSGVGVVYVSDPDIQNRLFFNVQILGFQYCPRPTKQFSMVYKMSPNENLDTHPEFKRIVFRHDKRAAQLVYEMAYQQKRYFPFDRIAQKAQIIRSADYELSPIAFELCRQLKWTTLSDSEIKDILDANGIKYHNDNRLIKAHFELEEIAKDIKDWESFGRIKLDSSLLPTIPVYQLPNVNK